MIYFSTVCYPQKILNHHLFFPRGTFISCFPFLADAGKNAWMQTLLYSAFIVERHIITVSVFSLPWDLHSWGGLGSFCRMLKELNKCFGVDVHLSRARKHYPPKQSQALIFLSLLVRTVIFQVSFHPLWLSGAISLLSLADPGGLGPPCRSDTLAWQWPENKELLGQHMSPRLPSQPGGAMLTSSFPNKALGCRTDWLLQEGECLGRMHCQGPLHGNHQQVKQWVQS